MLKLGEFKSPSLFQIGNYKVFFWSNDINEPIHVHIGKGVPSPNATKIWLTFNGGCIIASNAGRIPKKDLHEMLEVISAQSFMIRRAWKKYFLVDHIKYYC